MGSAVYPLFCWCTSSQPRADQLWLVRDRRVFCLYTPLARTDHEIRLTRLTSCYLADSLTPSLHCRYWWWDDWGLGWGSVDGVYRDGGFLLLLPLSRGCEASANMRFQPYDSEKPCLSLAPVCVRACRRDNFLNTEPRPGGLRCRRNRRGQMLLRCLQVRPFTCRPTPRARWD